MLGKAVRACFSLCLGEIPIFLLVFFGFGCLERLLLGHAFRAEGLRSRLAGFRGIGIAGTY